MNAVQTQPKSPAAVAAKRSVEELITGDRFKQAVTLSLPKHCKPERFIRVALTAFNRTPKLRHCSQESLFNCFLRLSELGIEADGRRAHLIPYGTECTLIVDYKGLAELIMRSGEVSHLHADIVCDKDEFEFNLGQIEKHRVNFREDRGEMYAAYALAKLKDGNTVCQVLSKSEVDAVRKRSRAGGAGPWVTDYHEMAKKTAFRRLSKWLPLSPELRERIEADDEPIDVPSKVVSAEVPTAGFLTPPEVEPATESHEAPSDDASAESAAGLAPETPKVQKTTPPPPVTLPGAETAGAIFQREVLDKYGIEFDAWRTWAISKGLCDDTAGNIGEVKPQFLRGILKSGLATMLSELGVKVEVNSQGGLL